MRTLVRIGALVAVLVVVSMLGANASAAAPRSGPAAGPLPLAHALASSVTVKKNITVGKDPGAVVYDPANHLVYVALRGASSVKAINATTNTVAKTIAVGKEPIGLVYDPSNKDLYVENYGSNSFSVISSSDKVVATVAIRGSFLGSTIYDGANGAIYTLSFAFVPPATLDYNLSKIDATTQAVTIIPIGTEAGFATYDNASADIVVSNPTTAKLSVVNGTTNKITTVALTAGKIPAEGLYNAANKDLYVLDEGVSSHGTIGTGNISVLSASNKIVATIKTGINPAFLQLDPANHDVYVTDLGKQNTGTGLYPDSNLTVISTANKVATTLMVGKFAGIIAYSPKTNDLYVPCAESNTTYIVNATTNVLLSKTVATPQYPTVAVYSAVAGEVIVAGNANYTGTPTKSDLTVVSTGNIVAGTVVLGVGPLGGYAYDPTVKASYVSNEGAGTVSVLV
ncbi:MAG TPA: YncE family protein [Thermoplasmata archaeon]|nr:YncE family protein [Thermoplasmata archaeon]